MRDDDGSWFAGARSGIFVHWSHASVRGLEVSWPLVGGAPWADHPQAVPVDQYHATASSFAPRPGAARDWMRAARRARARYAVLTAKHHDGFALFPSEAAEFGVGTTLPGRDLVGEFVEAARAEGIRPGLYFSLPDWHHPDYPAFRDEDRPYSFGRRPRPTPEQWDRYLAVLFAQLRELLTRYGRIDLLWFDGGWERSAPEWRAEEIERMVRDLQPGIVLNDRLPGVGDYATPEQIVPANAPAGPWETCLTMNETWGWNPDDRAWKSARDLVHALCETASRGGNLLLNVSPRDDGSLPPEQVERLDAIGGWLDAHGESIFDTGPGLEPWQFHGPSTRKGNRVFLHLVMRPYESVVVRGVPIRRVASARELRTGRALEFATRCSVPDRIFNQDPTGEVSIRLPEDAIDPLATVVELVIRD
ncbi:MAG: alpha-L-fucosidase [Alphaproteobacteria bacterium]